MDFFDPALPLSLDTLRRVLVRLEDTIVFALIERAQFKRNDPIYRDEALIKGEQFLKWFMGEMERVHAKVRRYQSPDEYPFSDASRLPAPILPPDQPFTQYLQPNNINVNEDLYRIYTTIIVPRLCEGGDDRNYGSAATKDVDCLMAISKRVHYGKFIAEAKFQQYKEDYSEMIKRRDREGIMKKLTNTAVENKLIARLRKKAMIYGKDLNGDDEASFTNKFTIDLDDTVEEHRKVDVDLVTELYRQFLIPLTKEVEVEYLLSRKTD